MRNLTCHLAPCTVPLCLCQLLAALRHSAYHLIVGLHQSRHLILAVVLNLLKVVDVHAVHLLAQTHYVAEQVVCHHRTQPYRQQHKHEEQAYDKTRVHHSLAVESVVLVRIRTVYNRKHVPVRIENRCIERVVALSCQFLLVDEISLALLRYAVVGVLV